MKFLATEHQDFHGCGGLYLACATLIVLLHCPHPSPAQQVADTLFSYLLKKPQYPAGTGPVITLDEAHFNFHKLNGRYYAFGKLLKADGYRLKSGAESFSRASLAGTRILVIANALADEGPWTLPAKSAFTKEEIAALNQWVRQGGSLFLIADHMPFPGTNEELALSFGINFYNGFARRLDKKEELFSRKRGNLTTSVITDGRSSSERIDSILVFTGQGFRPPPEAVQITKLLEDYEILLPNTAWEFSNDTPVMASQGLVNGCYLEFGAGRVVVFGEAAMFSAQVQGAQQTKMGMNHPRASHNPQLLLNIIHWLDRKL